MDIIVSQLNAQEGSGGGAHDWKHFKQIVDDADTAPAESQ